MGNSIILIGTEIGKASLTYWSENIADWGRLNESQTGSKTEGWFSWGEVAGSDVAGAVGAAIVNVAVGPGTVAYGAAILGAGARGSAASAAKQVWDHIF